MSSVHLSAFAKGFAAFARCVALLFAVAAAVSACRPTELYLVDPGGPPEYQLGWQDGCDTGLSAQGGIAYKMMFGFKKRPELGNSDQYKQGWNEGFTYCRFSIATTQDGLL